MLEGKGLDTDVKQAEDWPGFEVEGKEMVVGGGIMPAEVEAAGRLNEEWDPASRSVADKVVKE